MDGTTEVKIVAHKDSHITREYFEMQNVMHLNKNDMIIVNGKHCVVTETMGEKVRFEPLPAPVIKNPSSVYLDEASDWGEDPVAKIRRRMKRLKKREAKRWKKIHSRQGRQ